MHFLWHRTAVFVLGRPDFLNLSIPGREPSMLREPVQQSGASEQQAAKPLRNPYILNFCRALVEKKGETHETEALDKLLNDMYCLYEYMLGQNMVNSLPEDLRKHYLGLTEDLANLSYEKIGEVFDQNIADHKEVMKKTMKQFAEIFLKNRQFNPEDYPIPEGFSQA